MKILSKTKTQVHKGEIITTKRKQDVSEWIQCYLMILIPILGFLTFTLYPIIWVLDISLYDFDGIYKKFIYFDNYVRIFTRDIAYWNSVVNTFIIGFGKLLIEIPLAMFLAVVLNNKIRGRNIFRIAYFMPSILSSAIMALVFYFLFSSYNGIVNNLLMSVHLIQAPINWFGTRVGASIVIVFASVWLGVGVNMILFLAALQSVPSELYECGELDGASKVQQFIHITVPMLAPITRTIVLLAIIGTMKIGELVLVLTGGGPAGQTDVMMTYVFKYFFTQGDVSVASYGYASALGFVTAVIIAIVSMIFMYLSRKSEEIY